MSTNRTTGNSLTPSLWETIDHIAPVLHQSRLFGVSSPAAAAAIMLKGHELGFQLAASLEFIRTVEGRPTLSAKGMLALLHNAKHVIAELRITQLLNGDGTHMGHECYIRRVDGFEHAARFTLEDARRAGLIKPNSNWEKYPERMTLWRSVDFCADVAAPDVTNGINTAAKFDVEIVDGQWLEADPIQPIDVAIDETAAAALLAQELVNQYGAESVLASNSGAIPVTLEEVDAVRYRLIAEEEE